ncbi:DUF6807 family protein [Tautonia plasticadhaerens]|uniref:Methane oxygenase PmoA n=1 Tax=Tautonia plasticadhaerens TaxID=2527974 RepID=A0A518GY76_9BACT|nr:DUF6807 family protein [Tautonia plasticadhaerens]QDV33535.1 hypothetical protein ElP_14080 [Tautonia plasticadhaerens]
MRRFIASSAVAATLLAALPDPSVAQSVTIEVEAGEHDRSGLPVRAILPLPDDFSPGDPIVLTAEGGTEILGQLTAPSLLADRTRFDAASGRVALEVNFIPDRLDAGESARFEVSRGETGSGSSTFSWEETDEGDRLSFGSDPLLLYVRPELDESSPETREQTYKPFHHLFAPDGRRLSKGPGGLYTHHRGLFFGYNRVSYGDGKQADVWHARGKAFQSHEETLSREAGPVLGRHLARIDWHGQEGEVFARETRELTAYATVGGRLIEFASRVETTGGPVMLDGDPQHAGVHFRADNHVADETKGQTYYLRPDGKGAPGETRNWEPDTGQGPINLPWNAMGIVVDGERYTVCYLDHPENPKEARYSERDYGRFGSYFEYELTEDQPLEIRYRLWIQDAEMTLEQVAALDADFDEPASVRVLQAGE